uniref:Uncharacterized protein n=1 Tax=Anguilla anguilla TaxID=7936 RepID=A0A0E9WMB7_ANGAN
MTTKIGFKLKHSFGENIYCKLQTTDFLTSIQKHLFSISGRYQIRLQLFYIFNNITKAELFYKILWNTLFIYTACLKPPK